MTEERFWMPDGSAIKYRRLFTMSQKYIAEDPDVIMQKDDVDLKFLEAQIKRYLIRNHIRPENSDVGIIAGKLAQDMSGTSVLSKYLDHIGDFPTLEEINVNSWDNIVLRFTDQPDKRLKDTFLTPRHALDIINKIISRNHGKLLNETNPVTDSYITESVRISAKCFPIVSKWEGVVASIRIVRPSSISESSLLSSGSLSKDMMSFLKMCVKYGVSVLIAGKVGSGKTTLLNYLLNTVAENSRIETIEEGSRELSLQKCNIMNHPLRQVISVLTRPSENKQIQDLTANRLLASALRDDCEYIVPQEMRSEEAYTAVEAALTGSIVLSTIHSNDAQSTYTRIVMLMQKQSKQPFSVLLSEAVAAFPIIVYLRQLADKSRRCMEIIEGAGVRDDRPMCRTLFRFVVDDNERTDGKTKVYGHFQKTGGISERVARTMLNSGAPEKSVRELMKEAET